MPSAQFVIDIAAEMPEGESTIAELDRLTANLMGSGKGAEHFQQAIKQVSAALDAAKAASAAATTALADGQEEYKHLERAALQAAKAEEKAAKMGVVPPDVARSAAQSAAAVDAMALSLKRLESEAGTAAKKEDALGASLANVKKLAGHVDKSIAGNAEKLGKLQGGLSAIGGPIGALGSKLVAPVKGFTEMAGAMGSANASALVAVAGIGAVAVAVVAVTAVLLAGTIAVASWAVGLADAKRDAGLATEAFEIMNPAVEALHDTIDGLTDTTGLSESAIDGIAKSLIDAKVSAADLHAALEAASLAERALGNGGANDFLAKMKASKKSVQEFSAETKSQLGGVVAKQLRGITAQTATLKTSVGRIFGDLDIEPVLSGLARLVGLFDENSAAGGAMKFLFESVFQPLINQADKASVVIEAFVLGFLIGLTKLYIAIKPAIKAVSEFLGFNSPDLADTLAAATKAGEHLVPVFLVAVGIFGALALAVGVAVAAVVAIQVAIYAMIAAVVYAGVKIVEGVIGAWNSATSYLKGINLGDIGTAIMQGLALGILGAGPAVVQALGGVVMGAVKGAKALLGIHSPSTVTKEMGGDTGEGFIIGVDDMAEQAQASLSELVAPPDVSTLSAQDSLSGNVGGSAPAVTSSAKGSKDSSTGGGVTINLQGAHLEFNGVADGPDSLERFKEMLTKLYEQESAASGGAVSEAA